MAATLLSPATATAATTGGTMTERWQYVLTDGDGYDPADPALETALGRVDGDAKRHWGALDKSTGRTALWADLAGDDEWYTTESVARLVTMSTAYASKGSALAGDTGLATDIRDAVRWIAWRPAELAARRVRHR
ncbi:hypothetical protein GCM10010174_71930 [Kutzneria viridogrisea]|nr:hypothetical protein [Kutzneria albida]MBA8923813.1 hyaluronate lyase [Kutzneria viridogrisea]